jgi:hypothetical protein
MDLTACGLRFTGKLGPNVYYYKDGIQVVRPYYIPVQPGTASQQNRWTIFSNGVEEWQALSTVQKEEWNSRAYHLHRPMTGFNYFMSIYLKTHTNPPPSTTPIAVKRIWSASIVNLRSPSSNCVRWYFRFYNPTLGLSGVVDNQNLYSYYQTAPFHRQMNLNIYGLKVQTTNYLYGDGVDTVYSANDGVQHSVRIKIPALSIVNTGSYILYPAIDGSTYWDAAMTSLACPYYA